MRNLDRRKHDVDVIERVLGDVNDAVGQPEPLIGIADVEVHPWLGGSITTAAQLTVGMFRNDTSTPTRPFDTSTSTPPHGSATRGTSHKSAYRRR
jgi:hypothetical protein